MLFLFLFLLLLLWLWLAWELLVLVRFFRFVLRLYHMWYWSTIAAAVRSKMAQGGRRCGRRSCLQLVEHFVDLPLLCYRTELV